MAYKRPYKSRKPNQSAMNFCQSPRWIQQSMQKRDAEVRDIIASGDLRAIIAQGRYFAEEIAEGTCAYPNLSAQLLENLREAYTFFVTGEMPREEVAA